MTAEKAEKVVSLFLLIFSTGLVAQLASAGMLHPDQWLPATVSVLGSLTAAVAVRVWRRPDEVRERS